MVNNERFYIGQEPVIRTRLGRGTGDEFHQTADGRWWEKWRGQPIGTGEEIKPLRRQQNE